MKFTAEVNYKYLSSNFRGYEIGISKQYRKLMKIVGKAIKDNKEVIFDYADNQVTVTIND